ncbi:MAG: DUF445 domain-containing protein [Microthrixaceae bacterium]|nr:DUF445 domain-containing protein [Microthrixaceae bacterium]
MTAPTTAPDPVPPVPPSPGGPSGPALPAVSAQAERKARLARMKRRATMFLGVATAIFLAVTLWGGDATWAGYVQATAEGGMVGGLADWFAVTALFRHPLGIPIPHTAIIVTKKDQFGETLGEFIQDAFLTPEAVTERIRAAEVGDRLAAWLRDPDNAARVSAEVMDGAVQVSDLVRDDDVQRVLQRVVRERLDTVPVAPLAGRALDFLIRDGRHQQALSAAIRELDRYLTEHGHELRAQLGARSPWWLPGAAEDRLFERLVDGAHTLLQAMLEDEGHHLRQRFEQRLVQLADDLRHDPAYRARGEELKAELLAQPQVGEWVGALWADAKAQLRTQAEDPDSDLRRRLADVVVATGERLHDEPALASRVDDAAATAATYLVEHFHGEIVGLVSGTIERWDAAETAERLELLLGPDLQFIRINGTVVGAAAGLALHTVAQVLA